jgi:hypothetical protein
MAMASSTGRAGTRTRHCDGKREHSANLARNHPPLSKRCRKPVGPTLAASLADLGFDLTKLNVGRHRFACRQHHRTAAMLVVVTGISMTWSCSGCGNMGGFSCLPRRMTLQVAP